MNRLLPGQASAWMRLLAPFRYLCIKHEFKRRFDIWWPLGLTIVTMGVFWILPVTPRVLSDGGFLKGVRDLIALLAAFYVVALAAVSTFDRPGLDKPMEGTPPTLDGKDQTRRQYVCFLFGYLSALSFVLFLVSVGAEIVAPSLRVTFNPTVLWWLRAILGSIFTFGFWSMIVTTMLGIWFLIERVHLKEPESGEPENAPLDRPRAAHRRAA
jgi:hypothetical protein